MKFTKHVTTLALGLIAAASLAGCSTNKTVVTFWNNYAVGEKGKDDYKAYWEMVDLIAEFEKKNPTIKVETKYYEDYGSIATAVNAGIKAGNTPSMALTYGTYAYNWEKYLVDVTEKGEAMEKDSDILTDYMIAEKQQYGGSKYYTLPFGKSTEALMINCEVFNAVGAVTAGEQTTKVKKTYGDDGSVIKEETVVAYGAPTSIASKKAYAVPTTFTEMMEIAAQMKVDYPDVFANQKDADGYYTACPIIYETAENLFCTVMESAGIDYMAASDEASKGVLFNNDEAKAAIVQLKKWSNEGLICVKNNLYYSDKAKGYHAYPSTVFGDGKCFMIIGTTRGSAWMVGDGYSAKYVKLPKWDSKETSKIKTTSQGGSICFFQKKDKAEQEAAMKFYDFLNEKENLASFSVATDYSPIRASTYETEDLKANIDAYNAKPGVTYSSSKADKTKAYAGNVLKLNESYAQSSESFMTPVNKYSSNFRSAVKNLIFNIFKDDTAKDDAAITKLVADEFKTAYDNTVKNG